MTGEECSTEGHQLTLVQLEIEVRAKEYTGADAVGRVHADGSHLNYDI